MRHGLTFAQLLRTHQGAVRAFLRRLTQNDALADDLAQDSFIKAHKSLGSLHDPDAARSWLYAIAYRVFLDHVRREKRRTDLSAGQLAPDTDAPAAPTGLRMDLRDALAALAPERRAVVLLCLALGHSHNEAAQILELPLGTVKSHMNRGRAQLQEQLSAYGEHRPNHVKDRG